MSVLNPQEVAADSHKLPNGNLDFPVSEVAIPEMTHDIKYSFDGQENAAAVSSSDENSGSSESASGSSSVEESS